MKKKKNRKPLELLLFFVLGIGVGIAFGMSSALLIRQNSKEKKTEYRYETTPLTSCEKETLYYSMKDKNVYLYCLNSIKVHDGNNLLELKNYLSNHSNELDEIIKEMKIVGEYEDGGSILYQDDGKLSENGFAMLKCSTIEGSKDIYIGPKNMKFENRFCQAEENPIKEQKTFRRTYHVSNVTQSNEEGYLSITVGIFQEEEEATVKVSSKLLPTIQANKDYEFQFGYIEPVEDTIDSIFKNTTLLSIRETDKVGLEQIQESME